MSMLSSPLRWAALAAGALFVATTAASAAPPFWGSTYAFVHGPSDVVIGGSNRPVQVGALVPPQFACSMFVSARLEDSGTIGWGADFLRGAPVYVTLAEGPCPAPGEEKWLRFSVPFPRATDILELIYVTANGKLLGREKVAIAPGSGGWGAD